MCCWDKEILYKLITLSARKMQIGNKTKDGKFTTKMLQESNYFTAVTIWGVPFQEMYTLLDSKIAKRYPVQLHIPGTKDGYPKSSILPPLYSAPSLLSPSPICTSLKAKIVNTPHSLLSPPPPAHLYKIPYATKYFLFI